MVLRKNIIYQNTFIALNLAFFAMYALHLGIDDGATLLQQELERKLSFAFLPFVWFNATHAFNSSVFRQILNRYSLFTVGMAVLLILIALVRFAQAGNSNAFLYHDLAMPIEANAIYFSMLLLFAVLFSMANYLKTDALIHLMCVIVGAVVLVLLSSKLFVVLLGLSLFYLIFRKRLFAVGIAVVTTLVGLTYFSDGEYSIRKRFEEIDLNKALSGEQEITRSTRFDGLNFRLELIDMGTEIVTDNTETMLFGVGPGNAQRMLDEQMEARNMYVGDPKRGDTGYKGYNFHNQYMQTWVETGLLGLFTLLLVLSYLLYQGIKREQWLLFLVNAIFVIGFTTESYLSRQIGVVAFIGFNALLLSLGKSSADSMNREIELPNG